MEQFLQGNVPLRHLLNEDTLFISWQRSAFNDVNDWTLGFTMYIPMKREVQTPVLYENYRCFFHFLTSGGWKSLILSPYIMSWASEDKRGGNDRRLLQLVLLLESCRTSGRIGYIQNRAPGSLEKNSLVWQVRKRKKCTRKKEIQKNKNNNKYENWF